VPEKNEAVAIADGVLRQVDPRSVTADRIAWWILDAVLVGLGLVAIVVLVLAGVLTGWRLLVVLTVWVTVASGLAVLARKHPRWVFQYTRYSVSPIGVEIRKGIIWRSVTSVPRSRIQHTDVTQGPLMRRFGIAQLVIHTAGTEHATVELAGISHERALELRDFLIGGGDADGL